MSFSFENTPRPSAQSALVSWQEASFATVSSSLRWGLGVLAIALAFGANAQARVPEQKAAKPSFTGSLRGLQEDALSGQKARAKALRAKHQELLGDAKEIRDDEESSQKVAQAPGRPPSKKCKRARGKIHFNHNEATVFDVLKEVSRLTCRNFIVSEGIKGGKKTLTIISHRPVSVDQAYAAFLSALHANNMALVRAGKFYKVVERKLAVKDTLPLYDKVSDLPWTDSQVTLLHELKHVGKDQVQSILKAMMSKNGDLQMVGNNLLVITDAAANIRRIVRILDRIDIAGAASSSRIHVVDILYAEVGEISQKLTDIFDKASTKGGTSKNLGVPKRNQKGGGKISEELAELEDVAIDKIVADERTNKLFIISSTRAFRRVKEVIDILDIPSEDHSATAKVYVHALNNADSQKMASTLSSLAQGSKSTRNKKKKKKTDQTASLFEGEVKVSADEATNSLVVVSSPRDFRALKKVIEELDVKRPQVFVEAAILEVSLTQNRRFSLDAYGGLPATVPGLDGNGLGIVANQGGQQLVTSSAQSLAAQQLFETLQNNPGSFDASNLTNVVDATQSLENLLGWLAFRGPAIPGSEEAFGFAVPSFGMVLNALQTNAAVDVLSTPHIMTTDNEKAEISVGERIPVVRGISPAGSSAFGGLQQVAYEDVKLKFTVTPHVNADNDIRLEIEEEVSDLGGQVSVGNGLTQPIITNRSAKTTVVVKDQQTVIIGGLISNRKSDTESKFPILGDLPIIGWLFKQWSDSEQKTNLILVLTPYVIRDREDFREIYERKLKERQVFVENFFGSSNSYNPYVDYRKKSGPLARLIDDVEQEMSKLENGGAGAGGEQLITPDYPLVPFDEELPAQEPAKAAPENANAADGEKADKEAPAESAEKAAP
ncbi:MAG: type II secretion system secretin GspD [Deltaproteobacteria bacterium]|nr:type II secretion system secretin GspD [Deltaproteobacteria bacterium]